MNTSIFVQVRVCEGSILINDTHITFLSPDKLGDSVLKYATYAPSSAAIFDLTNEFSEVYVLATDIQDFTFKISVDSSLLSFTGNKSLIAVLSIGNNPEIKRLSFAGSSELIQIPSDIPRNITSLKLAFFGCDKLLKEIIDNYTTIFTRNNKAKHTNPVQEDV